MKDFEELAREPFSKYASSLNSISKASWPVFIDTPPLKINLSRKSILRPLCIFRIAEHTSQIHIWHRR